jgi:hypothetical protein
MRSIIQFFGIAWLAIIGGGCVAALIAPPSRQSPHFHEDGEPLSW